MTLHLEPSDNRVEAVVVPVACPACGGGLRPLGASNTSGITAWLPVKCLRAGCRRDWAIKTQLVAVTDQSQAHYLGVA